MKAAWDMGVECDANDIAEAAGFSLPTVDAVKVFNPQIVGAIRQMNASGSFGAGTMDPMAVAIGRAMQDRKNRDDLGVSRDVASAA